MAISVSNKQLEGLLALAEEGKRELESQRAALRDIHGFKPDDMAVIECDAAQDALALIAGRIKGILRG